ncbi:MAG: NAD-dependent epimerase/dehydratase family protein [Gemmatimonadota bacterium]
MATGVETKTRPHPVGTYGGPSLRILVTGADGFLGCHLLPRLLSRGHMIRAVHRGLSGAGEAAAPGVDWRIADMLDPDSLIGLASECDCLIHLAGNDPAGLSESAPGGGGVHAHALGAANIAAEARRAGIQRLVLVSALGSDRGNSSVLRDKFMAEETVRASGLDYVILRPSVIYGPGDALTSRLALILRRLPVFPLLGDGRFVLQPVAVEDIIDALAQAVERRDVSRSLFELVGPDHIQFNELIEIVGRAIGIRRPVLRLPAALAAPVTWLTRTLRRPYPMSPSQLNLLRAGGTSERADNSLRTVFRVKPLPFEDVIQDYL